jgi:hypothetical protein
MKKTDFIWLCNQHTIDPSIALEDERVKNILKSKSNSLVKQFALNTYFKNNY